MIANSCSRRKPQTQTDACRFKPQSTNAGKYYKKAIAPVLERKVWAQELQATYVVSIAVSCQVVCISRTAYYYQHKLSDDSEIIDVLNKLTDKHNRWGFPKCFKRIGKLGYSWNNKRVHRVYTALNLNLRRKAKRRLPTRDPQPLSVPNALGLTSSMDFLSDRLHNNIRFRTFNVIDDYNREVLGIDIGTSIPLLRVIRYLDQIAKWHGYPKQIHFDNGGELTSSTFTDWASAHSIYIDYTERGCPYQNTYIERFNRSYRNEVLKCYLFNNLNEITKLTED